jgi:hypothetical protein
MKHCVGNRPFQNIYLSLGGPNFASRALGRFKVKIRDMYSVLLQPVVTPEQYIKTRTVTAKLGRQIDIFIRAVRKF